MPNTVLLSPVVSTQWLADYLGREKLLIVDVSVLPAQAKGQRGLPSGYDQYLVDGHVPGAVFADLVSGFSDANGRHPFARPGAEQFEAAAASIGVDNDTTVIVYDSALGQWASRLWWLFRAFGYDNVAVLNGGLKKWKAEGRLIETGHVEPPPARFEAVERPELWVDKAEVEAIVAGNAEGTLVCATPEREFVGAEGAHARLGHIPGSTSAPLAQLVNRETNGLRSPDELRATLAPLLERERVVAYCAAGIAASADALALVLLGQENVAIYDGSLNEWVADPLAPLETAVS